MNTKASSVTDMLKKLSDKNLAEYIPYKGARLTENGVRCANQIIRKHRLWEVFLVEKLDFSWDEVHEVAEQLEHIQSQKLIDQLDKHLDYPKKDPHGDPIPDSNGNYEVINKTLLSQLTAGDIGTLVGVIDTSSNFLNYLDKHNIQLGTQITVMEREDFDNSFTLQVNSELLQVSQQIADNLYLKITS
ncbi:putative Mn-or Fe-dependent transcriptional regulator [Nonlabens dokdonensis DSW-6]|uniref:Transcriptional regulator MntR n=2 Tax=Nonlabens dokdonensis TaxID=328515 RepID=L7WD32_NONDD|nr:putative Mn-or Fe-dependent transcriptional regulator [Nonlabens dokdonensis DSW-6]